MRTFKLLVTALALTGVLAMPTLALAAKPAPSAGAASVSTALAPLSEAEIATLQWMREEEKLARDVYLELNAFWPAQVFVKIAESEQRHFDELGVKLELYGVFDPALPNVGDFSNPELQALHDELLAKGMASYVAALEVGVLIEEKDMVDLRVAIDGTTSVPLQVTYEHLLSGSARHLDSFVKVLATQGVVYDP